MPPRVARASVASFSKKSGKRPSGKATVRKTNKRAQDAYAIAGKLLPTKGGRSHRLGEVGDDEPRNKRRRTEDGQDESSSKRQRQDDEDGYIEHGSDSEGNEWTLGGVGDGDDESIDSDEAFGESDEEYFEGYTFRGSSGNKSRPVKKASLPEQDDFFLDESDEEAEIEDDFGDEGVDLATMLDDEDEEEEESEDADDESLSEQSDEEDDGEDDDEGHARLQDFVAGLSYQKKERPKVVEAAGQLELDDLLDGIDIDKKALTAIRPSKESKSRIIKPALPKRQQNAINRKLAKEKADEALDQYNDTVTQNRQADYLNFPLRDATERDVASKDTFHPAEQSAPTNDLEANIRQIMEESGMIRGGEVVTGEDGFIEAEGMATRHMTIEQERARVAELARQRSLLFHEEMKAKRVSKIKSKAYRARQRKERARVEEDLEDFEQVSKDAQRRAEARMNAKYKNSQWAKKLKQTAQAMWNPEARASLEEQARREQELKQHIGQLRMNDVNFESEDSEDDDYTEDLAKLAKSQAPEATGLAAMKFMQAAAARRKKETDAAIYELQRELGDEPEDEIEDNGLGRAIFGPKKQLAKAKPAVPAPRSQFEEGDTDDESAVLVTEKGEPDADDAPAQETRSVGRRPSKKPLTDGHPQDQEVPASTSAWLQAPKKSARVSRNIGNDDGGALITTDIANDVQSSKQKSAKTAKPSSKQSAANSSEDSDSDAAVEQPLLSKAEQNAAFHARAFAGDDVAAQFQTEKDERVESEDEQEKSSFMPGWGTWAGEGLTKRTRKANERRKHNPLLKYKVDGIRPQNRKDAGLENVIITEKESNKGDKYKVQNLPRGFRKEMEYDMTMQMPLGREWTTHHTFKKNTAARINVKPGAIIEPLSRPLI